tara:strand:- start:300 stop:830 length:531 start_codon:yes stop_codon:yes gene_type:complete
MDINNIYITGHIIKNIIDILDLEDKISFTTCNKTVYEKYYDNIKVDIYKYVNNDYKYFKRFINTFKYDILTIKTLGLLTIINPNVVWGGYKTKYYDLRYIYELIMKDLDINDMDIVNVNTSINIRFILNTLKKCKSINRYETKVKIQNEPCLRTLHYDFTLYPINNRVDLLEWVCI